MKLTPHIQNILNNSKKDTEWKKEAEERKSVRQESRKSGMIATQLAFFMKSKRITQTELGKLTEVSPQQISKILKGRENLTLGTIEKIETALKIELIQTVNLESKDNGLHFVQHDPKSSSIPANLDTIHIRIASEPKFYGGSMNIPSLPAFANSYYEDMKQKAIARAHERFEKLNQTGEFHFESEIILTQSMVERKKSPQNKIVWVESENYIAEEI